MTKLFGVDIAKELNKAMGPGLLPVILKKFTNGTRTDGSLSAGTNPGSRTYNCRGFTDSYADSAFDDSTIKRGDRKVLILGASLPAGVFPETSDEVTVEGRTYKIFGIPERDPASATYICQGRGS